MFKKKKKYRNFRENTQKLNNIFNMQAITKVATLGGGCFWCTDTIYRRIIGVTNVQPGYANGTTHNPTYKQVCTGSTGHAEVIQFNYDPNVVSFDNILRIFFTIHDPTTKDR